jgi:phosphatidylserine decarboxylase
MDLSQHQYVERDTGRVRTERPIGDWIVNYLYSPKRERAPLVYDLLGSQWFSRFLGWVNYDFPMGQDLSGMRRFLKNCAVNLDECLARPAELDSARKVFERRIRYWQHRPMSADPSLVVCPADSRVLLGSLREASRLFIKGKFFEYEELIGVGKTRWLGAFRRADFVICRLTPDKYHYNHTPVAGVVLDIYESEGKYHSCNPGPVVTLASPYSKNRRVVTVIDTDVIGGTRVGLVAMIEIVALMIGDIQQCYSQSEYRNPRPVERGMFLERGCPKSLFRPGSSTTVVLFQDGRVEFAADLLFNVQRSDVVSRYSQGLGKSLVETDVQVRSGIGRRKSVEKDEEKEVSDDFQ